MKYLGISMGGLYATAYLIIRMSFVEMQKYILLPNFNGTQMAFLFTITYTIMQIPCGYLIDKFGIRPVSIIMGLISTIGLFICGVSQTINLFIIGRILSGIGLCGGFLFLVSLGNTLKNKNLFTIIISYTIGFSLICAMGFINLLPLLLKNNNNILVTIVTPIFKILGLSITKNIVWQSLFIVESLCVFFITIGFLFFIPQTVIKNKKELTTSDINIFSLLKNRKIILIMLLGFVSCIPFYSILETIFISDYLKSFSTIASSKIYSMGILGFLFGTVFIPIIERFLGNSAAICCILSLTGVASLLLYFGKYLCSLSILFALFLIGMSNCIQFLITNSLKELVPESMLGQIIGILNVLFVGTAPFSQLILPCFLSKFGGSQSICFFSIIFIAISFLLMMIKNKCYLTK